jgi:2-amino-4-hydroxy-6-hydroxymethyldihydropteridine diphosphokinase
MFVERKRTTLAMNQENNAATPLETQTHTVYLSLGSNLEDRQSNLHHALQKLQQLVHIQHISSVYETEPVGYLDQPYFFNIVCSGTTQLTAQELLIQAKTIEKSLGRQSTIRNGPRPIDIDILLYDTCIYEDQYLSLPHPRLKERAFVLVPLVEISPGVVEPQSGRTAQDLLQAISQSGVKKTTVHL